MADSIPIAFPAPETSCGDVPLIGRGRQPVDSSKPIIDSYLLPDSHGTCRRFCCECCLIVGLSLPLLGPLLGLCVFVPYFDLLFEEGNVIQPNAPCFSPAPGICPTSSKFDYYFWNITNAEEVSCMQGASPLWGPTNMREPLYSSWLCLAMNEYMTSSKLIVVAERYRASSVPGAGSVCV